MTNFLLNFATFFATTKHGKQLYGGKFPYAVHLVDVENQVISWWTCIPEHIISSFTEKYQIKSDGDFLSYLCAMAWLHDVLEDCKDVKRKDIDELFGPFIGEVVWRVTNETGINRKDRHAITYPKIKENPIAIFIKLCDRIANIEAGGSMVSVYYEEQEEFERSLRINQELYRPMWDHLNHLLSEYAIEYGVF